MKQYESTFSLHLHQLQPKLVEDRADMQDVYSLLFFLFFCLFVLFCLCSYFSIIERGKKSNCDYTVRIEDLSFCLNLNNGISYAVENNHHLVVYWR